MSTSTTHMIRRRDGVRAEMTKIITHPSTLAALGGAFIANLLLAAIDTSGVTFYVGSSDGPSSISEFGLVMLVPLYAFLVIPAYAAASEYQGGQLRMSLVATPHRGAFVAAKLVAVSAVATIGALIVIAPARIVMGVAEGLSVAAVSAACGAWFLAYVFMSLVAFGLAGVMRSAISALGILIALPIVIATGVLQWPAGLRFLPEQAALSLVGTPQFEVNALPAAMAATTLATWSALAVASYALTLTRRDA